jgi:hypothetical protein
MGGRGGGVDETELKVGEGREGERWLSAVRARRMKGAEGWR